MNITEKINKLPEDVREYVCSNEVRLVLEQVCFLYDILEDKIGRIALPIGDIIFGEVQLIKLPFVIQQELGVKNEIACGIAFELSSRIFSKFPTYFMGSLELQKQWETSKVPPLISEEKAWRRVLEIEPWILEDEKEKQQQERKTAEVAAKQQAKIDKLSLEKALAKYPNLGEQAVSLNPLKLRYFQMLVRPSIRNWITDYHDALGASKHGAIERGNFLFQSENGKKLTPMERQKVALLLKSLDEETPLEIDSDKQQIVFDFAGEKMVSQANSLSSSAIKQEDKNLQPTQTEDLAQARIRQALNFEQNSKKAKMPVLAYEEENYSNSFQQKAQSENKKISANSLKSSLGAKEQTQFGLMSFSSAQKLPVENDSFSNPPKALSPSKLQFPVKEEMQNTQKQPAVSLEKESVEKVAPESFGNWKSPDFKTHIASSVKSAEKPVETVQAEPLKTNYDAKKQSTFSPYVIDASTRNSYEDQSNNFEKPSKEPRIQGNVVDLS